MSINLAKPMETVEQFPFVLCAWPSFADQPYITNYRIYDDRVGETTRFTNRPDHEWYTLEAGPEVRRLPAGGKWIRTLGPALEKSASVAEKLQN